jgi:hypothetical protein
MISKLIAGLAVVVLVIIMRNIFNWSHGFFNTNHGPESDFAGLLGLLASCGFWIIATQLKSLILRSNRVKPCIP